MELKKVRIKKQYNKEISWSILKLFTVKWNEYNFIVINSLPTSYGRGSLINFFGMLLPLFIVRLKRGKVALIYHNSTLTNDTVKLGYSGIINGFKRILLRKVEIFTFMNVKTFLPVELYSRKINELLKKNITNYINLRFFEGISSQLLGKNSSILHYSERSELLNRKINILLHGSWGPQKNLEYALKILSSIRLKNFQFKLTVSGSVNRNFPKYKTYFAKLLNEFRRVVDNKIGFVPDNQIKELFLRSGLVIIPYNASGGHSSVIETAISYGCYIIAFDFPEYREQTFGIDTAKLIRPEELEQEIINYLVSPAEFKPYNEEEMIAIAMGNIGKIFENFQKPHFLEEMFR